MAYHLSAGVQLRKESWGLLFYSQKQHRLFFIKSGEWLFPSHFDGTWTFDGLVDDIALHTGASTDLIEHNLRKSFDNLIKNGMVTYELS
jgi:putative mycofactocin binding protein MftB